jgi:cytochrome P450
MAQAFKRFKLPPDIHRPDQFADLSREFEKSDSLFYVDPWPFINPLLIVASPNYAIQACQQSELGSGRPDDLVEFMHPIAGGNNIFTSNGVEWKNARNVLADGFNSNYILNQTEHIVQAAEVFVDILKECARKKEIALLDRITIKYAMDISGVVAL